MLTSNRLFWKIFGVFLLAMLSALAVNIYLTRQLAEIELDHHEYRSELTLLAKTGANLYESEGRKALKRWYKALLEEQGLRIMLLDEDGIPLAFPARSPSTDAQESDNTHQVSSVSIHPGLMRFLQERTHTVSQSGRQYQLKLLPSPYVDKMQQHLLRFNFLRPLSTILIILLASWWLSRHLARPIRSLTQASHQLADGSLSTRIDATICTRKDELGTLASSFNQMATRIEWQVTHHKQLLRDISHELRTPLTRQQLAIALLREEGANAFWLDKLEQQNQQLNELIESVLALSRLQQTTPSQKVDDVDVAAMLIHWQACADLEAEHKNIVIDMSLTTNDKVLADPSLLQRALDNVLNNAIKYSPLEGHIRVRLFRADMTSKELVIEIQDEGPGVPEHQLKHLFTPFFRTDAARSSNTSGFGLGLSISKEIIEQIGGSITVDNVQPHGLLVSIRIPISQTNPQI